MDPPGRARGWGSGAGVTRRATTDRRRSRPGPAFSGRESPLQRGRMRIAVECNENCVTGSAGSIRIELYRKGLSALSDEADYKVVEKPESKEKSKSANVPDFEVIPVLGPEDSNWIQISDDDTDVRRHASNAIFDQGRLLVYYSTAFPRFATELRRFEQLDPAVSPSFKKRYELWIAVHALLMYQQQQDGNEGAPEETAEEFIRDERCRFSVIATMFASQEAKTGVMLGDSEGDIA